MKAFSRKRPEIRTLSRISEAELEERIMSENKRISTDINDGLEQTRAVLVRFAPQIAARLEADARERDASPTEIVRAIVREHYSERGKETELLNELRELIEDRFRHIVYEIPRTRASLYRIAEESPGIELSTETLRGIFEITRDDARIYIDTLDAEICRRLSALPARGEEREE